MKLSLLALLSLLAVCPYGDGQVVIYQETFPYPGPSGDLPISSCGWSNAIPNNLNRLYQLSGSSGAVFAYQADADVPITTAFLTTTSLDNGAMGMAFPSFNRGAICRAHFFCGHTAGVSAGQHRGAFRRAIEWLELVRRRDSVAGADDRRWICDLLAGVQFRGVRLEESYNHFHQCRHWVGSGQQFFRPDYGRWIGFQPRSARRHL